MSHQDWKPVIFNKVGGIKKLGIKSSKYKIAHKKPTEKTIKNAKLDDSSESKKIPLIPSDIRLQLIKGRTEAKLKQKELAAQMSLPVKIIQDIENGKAKNNMRLFLV